MSPAFCIAQRTPFEDYNLMFAKDKPSDLEEGFHNHRTKMEDLVFLSLLWLKVKTFSSAFSHNFCLSVEIMALISCV